MKKKILIIAYYYPPINSGGTIRPVKMAKYLPDFGWEVTVLTHTYDLIEPAWTERIIRIKDISQNKNRKGIRGLIWLGLRLYTEVLNRMGSYHSIYTWWKKRIIKNSRGIIEWVKPDVIIASYPPVETLEIGIHLSQTYHLPLICDFRDGILFEPIERPRMERYSCIKKKYEEIEREAVNTATAVITIADPITNYFRDHYRVKAETIASGFDPADFQDVPVPASFDPAQFHIVFTGRFGLADGSNRVEFFFEALRLMAARDENLRDKLRVHLVGDFMRSDLEPIKDLMDIVVVINHGLVSREESLGYQKMADLLLIITLPDRTCSVSTKIYEYLYSGKPILALTYGTVLADMVEKTHTGWIVHPQQPEAISRLLERIVLDREFYNSLQPDLNEINKYSFVFQIEKLIPIINESLNKYKQIQE
ncbi:MAG TPA: glycosyltransferase [Candidatus Kapabacteria bacterium]|nr:glycosyltransferase [Candidatus Kapabacteria bacterium]